MGKQVTRYSGSRLRSPLGSSLRSQRLASPSGFTPVPGTRSLEGLRLLASLAGGVLLLVIVWNLLEPLPPAWDEAQHLLQAQAFQSHLARFDGSSLWWQQFWHLSQRYPPLTYWLVLPFGLFDQVDRGSGQVLNLLMLGILGIATHQIGRRIWPDPIVGWLAAVLVLLYPSVTGLAHVYMTDLILTVAVTLAFWAMLSFWQQPTWIHAIGVGVGVALVLLTKWTGIFFLLVPLAGLGIRALWRLKQGRIVKQILQLIGAGAVVVLLSWPWYSANGLFVISNGLNYAATAHYYEICPQGSLCWWTIYLRWLPRQMSPILCGLPLLALLPLSRSGRSLLRSSQGFTRRPGWANGIGQWWDQTGLRGDGIGVLLTGIAGYLFYTWIGIKDVRFTVPLLPLLAVLSAAGVWNALTALPKRPNQAGSVSPLGLRILGIGGILACCWVGQPFTPGVTPLVQTIPMTWQGIQPQAALIEWLQAQAQPQDLLRSTWGVIPNTALIGSETLTYLARIADLPLAFRGAGQTRWPELEIEILDGFLNASGDQGIIGPYGPAKEEILSQLRRDPSWHVSQPTALEGIGILESYQPRHPHVEAKPIPRTPASIELLEIKALQRCQIQPDPCPIEANEDTEPDPIPVWQLHWQGKHAELANTPVWIDLLDAEGQRMATHMAVIGQDRLRLDPLEPDQGLDLTELRMLDLEQDLAEGSYELRIRWQPPDQDLEEWQEPWTGSALIPVDDWRSSRQAFQRSTALLALEQAAAAARVGDLDRMASYLNVWTTLQFENFISDPNRATTQALLQGRLAQAQAEADRDRQLRLHYQLGLVWVSQLQADRAQAEFESITQLEPENPWGWAYLAFLKILFTQDLNGWGDFKDQLTLLSQPLCAEAAAAESPNPTEIQICQTVQGWLDRSQS